MQLALNILGFPCYHGLTLFSNLRDCALWNAALDAKFFHKGRTFTTADWDRLLGNYSAVADLPAVAFPEDLIAAYPDARVVLVERDIERWYKSFDEGVMQNVWSPVLRLIAKLDWNFVGKLESISGRWTVGWLRANSLEEMRRNARPKYDEHYALVKSITPPDRLLVFKLDEGWPPLCKFLGVEIPDTPFPRVNEGAALAEKIGLIAKRGLWNAFLTVLKIAGFLAVMVFAAWLVR
ncbi:hypothetical protein LAWI1_G005190 [Lachnellula willkommii]|uniref:Uncharacterized protein n=1 Tax=Lachnellula willkommii TaxID=215461 RepID=A0A559M661_9HELO|nr:hypothetical protein LAWI1_G005190 [Lachnellula willkommii]